jgi:hypothetical protein
MYPPPPRIHCVAVMERKIKSLTTDAPPLPDFSRFHEAFTDGSGTREGDMRKAYYMYAVHAKRDPSPGCGVLVAPFACFWLCLSAIVSLLKFYGLNCRTNTDTPGATTKTRLSSGPRRRHWPNARRARSWWQQHSSSHTRPASPF